MLIIDFATQFQPCMAYSATVSIAETGFVPVEITDTSTTYKKIKCQRALSIYCVCCLL